MAEIVKIKVSSLTEAVSLDNLVVLGVDGANNSVKVPILLLKGNKGDSGTEIELQKTATHLQWRYVGGSWVNLVALADLKGDKGDTGANIELQKSATHIQWRVSGTTTWNDLVSLADLKGTKGDTGEVGPVGPVGPQGIQGPQGLKGDTGEGFTIKGYYNTLSALQLAVTNPNAGDAYGVGNTAPFDIYVYDSVSSAWVNNGALQGPAGASSYTYIAYASNDQGANFSLTDGAYIAIKTTTEPIANPVAADFAGLWKQFRPADLTANFLTKWDGSKIASSTRNDNYLYEIAWGTYLEANTTTSWPQIGNLQMKEQYLSQCGRYLVKNDGTAAKLNPTNSAFFTDGTAVDHSKGHTMWYSPDLYYLVTTEGGLPILWTSVIPLAGGKKAPAMCIGAYKAGMSATALVSKPDLVPTGSLDISQFWAAAQVNGKDWGLVSYEHRKKIVMQFLAEYGNTSIQAVLGVGLDGTGSSYDNCRNIQTGKTISLGDASGAVNTLDSVGATVQCISYRGLENLYGQIWEFVQGILSNNETVYIWEGNKMANDKPPVGVDYRTQTRLTSASAQYIDSMRLGEFFDIIPKTVGGGSTNRWADGHWSAAGGEVWLFGGHANHGSISGLSASDANNVFSGASSSVGARLAFYGGLKFVSGAQLNGDKVFSSNVSAPSFTENGTLLSGKYALTAHTHDLLTFLASQSTVTTLASLPVTKRVIVATVTAATTLSLAAALEVGRELHIKVYNTSASAITQPLPTSAPFESKKTDGTNISSISIPAGGSVEISILSVTDKYIIKTDA